jgi:hypothetical protein
MTCPQSPAFSTLPHCLLHFSTLLGISGVRWDSNLELLTWNWLLRIAYPCCLISDLVKNPHSELEM